MIHESITALDERLRAFVEQDDLCTMILFCSPADLVVPAKLMEARGRRGDGVVLLGIAACPTARDWMNGLTTLLQQQVTAANGIRKDEGLPPWPPLPLACMDPRTPVTARLRQAVDHCSRVLPEGERAVWVLLPNDCADRAGYAAAIRSLTAREPWQERHRFLVWDDRTAPLLVPELEHAKNEDVGILAFDFSPEKQLDRLVKAVRDRSRPTPMRMEALFQLAAVDFAYKRHAQALEKYGALFQYYEGKDPTRQAQCLLGAGDVAMEVGQPRLAYDRYRSGLAIAVPERATAVLLPLLMGAGKACLGLGRFAEAEGYLEYANQVAGKLFDAYAKADAIELRGVAQQGQKKVAAAIESWETCRELCERFAYEHRWKSALERELALYTAAQLEREALQVRARLAGGFERSAHATEAKDAAARRGKQVAS